MRSIMRVRDLLAALHAIDDLDPEAPVMLSVRDDAAAWLGEVVVDMGANTLDLVATRAQP